MPSSDIVIKGAREHNLQDVDLILPRNQLICLTDLFATAADILGTEKPTGSCEDSVSFLAALHGKTIETTRKGIIHHSHSGHFAYRQGKWKLLLARGSGGCRADRSA